MQLVMFRAVKYTGDNLCELGQITNIIKTSTEDDKLYLVSTDMVGNHYEAEIKKDEYLLVDDQGKVFVSNGKNLSLEQLIEVFKIG